MEDQPTRPLPALKQRKLTEASIPAQARTAIAGGFTVRLPAGGQHGSGFAGTAPEV